MNFFTPPALAVLAAVPSFAEAWSLGPSYFPASSLMFSSPTEVIQRQHVLMNRFFKDADRENFSSPRYEIIDNDNKFQLSVDVPGVKSSDIHVSLEDGYLSIRGQRKLKDESSYFNSKFSQIFSLDPAVDVDHLSASLNDGVLVVTAPKDMKEIEETVRHIPILQDDKPAFPNEVPKVKEDNDDVEGETVLDLDETDAEKPTIT